MSNTLEIIAVPAFNDNYIWLAVHQNRAACIDPGDAAPVLDYLQKRGLTLAQIWITHAHHDHTGGVAALKKVFPACTVYGNRDVTGADKTIGEGGKLEFGGYAIEVWATPGHTDTHLGYLLNLSDGLHVFCGDTLFSGGCGRVFTGTAAQLFASLQRYNGLPEHTLFYPAHEYTAANLRFAAHIEPDNPDIQTALAQANRTPTLPVTLAHERKINPFLRTAKSEVVARTAELSGVGLNGEAAVFAALRELKNSF